MALTRRFKPLRGRPAWGALALSAVALAGCGSDGPEPREAPWRLVEVEGRVLRLEVQAGGPPCDAVTSVEVDEDPRTVTVTVHAGPVPDARCGPGVAASLGTFPVEAKLRAPLGTRRLRDGAHG